MCWNCPFYPVLSDFFPSFAITGDGFQSKEKGVNMSNHCRPSTRKTTFITSLGQSKFQSFTVHVHGVRTCYACIVFCKLWKQDFEIGFFPCTCIEKSTSIYFAAPDQRNQTRCTPQLIGNILCHNHEDEQWWDFMDWCAQTKTKVIDGHS